MKRILRIAVFTLLAIAKSNALPVSDQTRTGERRDSISRLDQGKGTPAGPKLSPEDSVKRRSETIAIIKWEYPDPKANGIRDFYVQQLAFLIGLAEDREVVTLFLDRMAKDGNDWIRLEAAADLRYLGIPADMRAKVRSALGKCLKDKRIDFQVLAAHTLIVLAKRSGKMDAQAVKALSRIALGDGMAAWTVMVPPHNINSMVPDQDSGAEIPYAKSKRKGMRLKAMEGLWESGDAASRQVLIKLTRDSSKQVRERARFHLDGK